MDARVTADSEGPQKVHAKFTLDGKAKGWRIVARVPGHVRSNGKRSLDPGKEK